MNNIDIAKFKRLVKQGYCQSDIMEKMGISERTYFRHKKETSVDLRKKKIDKKAYFNLIQQGYNTKVELAGHLGVSNHTLIDWEKRNEALKAICQGLYVMGHKIILPNMLHVTKEKVNENTNGLPTINGVIKNLKIISDKLEIFAEFEPEARDDTKAISDAIKLLEEMWNEEKLKI